MTLETSFDSNYRKVLVAARRARQIQSGAAPLVQSHSVKACRVAQDEVDAGKVAYVRNEEKPTIKPEVEAPVIPILNL
jgi:DNA-directed RNA polymerase subunit omega